MEGDATQMKKPLTEEELIESDSDVTVPEPSSPQLYQGMPSLTQKRDLPLCKVLNIAREDRRSLCSHAFMLPCSFFVVHFLIRVFPSLSLSCILLLSLLCFCFVLSSFAFAYHPLSPLRQVHLPPVRPHPGVGHDVHS